MIRQDTVASTTHVIDRSNIFTEVCQLFESSEAIKEYPLRISFLNEEGFDTGGVLRDMLSHFWQVTLPMYFEGSNQVVPVIHAQTNMAQFTILGKIISHGYLVSGVFPLQIAFPTLASILLGVGIEVHPEILMSCFANSLSHIETKLVKDCLLVKDDQFIPKVRDKLMNLFSKFGLRQTPTPSKFKEVLVQAAKYEFLIKPMPAISLMHSGIPQRDQDFWATLSTDKLYDLYRLLTANPEKLLTLIEEPDFMNAAQERVFSYLQQYIGSMTQNELETFLRFVTGSSIMPTRLNVTFNSVSGLARRPVSHTCDNCIELSSSYATYLEFIEEIRLFMNDKKHSWTIDSV